MRALGNNPTHAEVSTCVTCHVQSVTCHVSRVQVNQLMARADVDHNGKLDVVEFIRMMHNYGEETGDREQEERRRGEELRHAFRSVVSNCDINVSQFQMGIHFLITVNISK